MTSLIQPLNSQVEIVDEKGRPTPQFIGLLQKLSLGTGLTKDAAGNITFATMAAKTILANKTTGSATPTACTIDDILDFIAGTAAQGDILYRGASGYKRLAAGTSGQFLKTNGPGADPTWATSSGGSGAVVPWNFSGRTLSVPPGMTLSTTASGVLTYSANGLTLKVNGSNNVAIAEYATIPSSTALTVDMLVHWTPWGGNSASEVGVLLKDNTGKIQWFGMFASSSTAFSWWRENWTSYSVFSSATSGASKTPGLVPVWLKVVIASGNITAYFSPNGIDYYPILPSISSTSFLGTTIASAGLWLHGGNTAYPVAGAMDTATLMHFAVSTP